MVQIQQTETLANLSKEELIARIIELDKRNADMMSKKSALVNGRPAQVLALIKDKGPISIEELAKALNVSSRDISTNLTTLRKAGHDIHTNGQGKKYLPTIQCEVKNDKTI